MSRKIIFFLIMFFSWSSTAIAAWKEPQSFGHFSQAKIYSHSDSLFIVGASSGIKYPAFVFVRNEWLTIARNDLTKTNLRPVIGEIEGGVKIVQVDDALFYVSVEKDFMILRKEEKKVGYHTKTIAAKSDSLPGLSGLDILDIEKGRILLLATIWLNDNNVSLYQSKTYVPPQSATWFLHLIGVFDTKNMSLTIYSAPPLKGTITSGAFNHDKIWLGAAQFSEMVTALDGSGIAILDIDSRSYSFMNVANSGISNDTILALKKVDNEIWVVSRTGIQKYDPTKKRWESFVIDKTVNLLQSTSVVLALDGKPILELPEGTAITIETTFSGMCSFLLKEPIYAWLTNRRNSRNKIIDKNGLSFLYYHGDTPAYSKQNTSSTPMPIFLTFDSRIKYPVVRQGHEWVKIQIRYGWISGNSFKPTIVAGK